MAREIQVASAAAELLELEHLAPELAARALLHVALQLGASRAQLLLDVVLGHVLRLQVLFENIQVLLDHSRAGESLAVGVCPDSQAYAKKEESVRVDGHVGGLDLGLRADGEHANPQAQLRAEIIELAVVEERLDLVQRLPRPSQQTKHARRVFEAQPRFGDKIFVTQPEHRALGDRVLLQLRLDLVSERVEALRRGPVAFAKVFKVDELGLFPVHLPRKPVNELVDAFPPSLDVSVDDAAYVPGVEPQNERPVHVLLPLEEILREVVPESRRELAGHRVHDVRNIGGDVQDGTADDIPPDVAEAIQNRRPRRSIRLLLRVAQSFPPELVARFSRQIFPVHQGTEELVRVQFWVR